MSHRAHIVWQADGDFSAGRYSRAHEWRFDGGAVIAASASPAIVPPPLSRPAAVDPEEAFVAALASCHMLWFLDLARQAGHVVARYEDRAEGRMASRADGGHWIEAVDLDIAVDWQGTAPDRAAHAALHAAAHSRCFIANSVRTRVTTNLRESSP